MLRLYSECIAQSPALFFAANTPNRLFATGLSNSTIQLSPWQVQIPCLHRCFADSPQLVLHRERRKRLEEIKAARAAAAEAEAASIRQKLMRRTRDESKVEALLSEMQFMKKREKAEINLGVCRMTELRVSPKKLYIVLDMVRGMHIEDAILQAKMCKKRAAVHVLRALLKARENAKQKKLDHEKLVVGTIYCTKGFMTKQPWFHGRGYSGVRRTIRSHLNVFLKEDGGYQRWGKLLPTLRGRKSRSDPYRRPNFTSTLMSRTNRLRIGRRPFQPRAAPTAISPPALAAPSDAAS